MIDRYGAQFYDPEVDRTGLDLRSGRDQTNLSIEQTGLYLLSNSCKTQLYIQDTHITLTSANFI
jgi:hypothetical protein